MLIREARPGGESNGRPLGWPVLAAASNGVITERRVLNPPLPFRAKLTVILCGLRRGDGDDVDDVVHPGAAAEVVHRFGETLRYGPYGPGAAESFR